MTVPNRPILESRLADASFAIVSAPAGFGKTTVVRRALERRPSVVWAPLGSAFRTDANTVVDGLADAARRLGSIADREQIVEAASTDTIGAAAIQRLSADFEHVTGPWTLVLDDLHRVPLAIQAEIAIIVSRLIGTDRHLVISTRAGATTLAGTWPVHHASIRLGPGDLGLATEDVATALGPDLLDHAARVCHATGGWARGVDVIRHHLEVDPIGGMEAAGGAIASIVAAEIMSLLEPDDLELLTTASLCDSCPLTIVERATQRPGAAYRLRDLADETGLVVVDGDILRHVPVFRSALERRMATSSPGLIAPTHRRLADAWLDMPATVEATEDAVHHLIAAGDHDEAVDVVQQRWGQMYTASRLELVVELMEQIPVRFWADDPGSTLLVGWSNMLIGRGARALGLLQSESLATPVGSAILQLVWAQGIWWSTAPGEAVRLVAEGRSRLDGLADGTIFPYLPGNDDALAFHLVATGADIKARFMQNDFVRSVEELDALVARRSVFEPISVVGLHAIGALLRAMRGDRHEALEHLRLADGIAREIGVVDHYLMMPAHLAGALLAVLAADVDAIRSPLVDAVAAATAVGAANFLRLCELVADMGGVDLDESSEDLRRRASRIPIVDGGLAARAARRLADLGDVDGALERLKGIVPSELTLSSWLHVLLMRYPIDDVRRWLAEQPPPTSAHGQVVRFLAEATLAETAVVATDQVRRAVAIASDRHLLGVVSEAPAALWERSEISTLDISMLSDVRRLHDLHAADGSLRFTSREVELFGLLAKATTAADIASRLYVSVNTVKWHKANIYRKLGVSGRRAAIDRAIELGLIADPASAI